ncbi:hypothetical protein JKF63_00897 [Porcisia hertigi]|uniref:Uncharacterized protein n=1 Tax=Porcisia hertigi TaxID=2761500 RepID=A0A836L1G7_9TRYP|nr:hypothetical protein JKF63_00897 [Porcisia hertigi]
MTEARRLHGPTAEATRGGVKRSFPSVNEGRLTSMVGRAAEVGGGGTARQPPTSISQGSSQCISGNRSVSSSLVLSSDTVLASLDVPPSEPIASGEMLLPSPLWDTASASQSAQDLDRVPSLVAVSSELRASLEFPPQLDIKAEEELRELWSALWSATHSRSALQAALEKRRARWNPYRPVRGGPGVKDEILRSQVVEFRSTVPTDSLYIHGVAVPLQVMASADSVIPRDASATVSTQWITPASPDGTRERQKRHTSNTEETEEVLVMDRPSSVVFQSRLLTPTSPTRVSHGTALQSSSHSAARRAKSQAALFSYLSKPAAFFAAAGHTAEGAARRMSGSLMSFAHLFQAADDMDASGVVTAFGMAQKDIQECGVKGCRRLCFPLLPNVPPVHKSESSSLDGGLSPHMTPARPPPPGSSGPCPVAPSRDLDMISDDSIEVEVLQDGKGDSRGSLQPTALLAEKGHHRGGSLIAPIVSLPGRRKCRRERPSTACMHGVTVTPGEAISTNRAPRGLAHPLSSTQRRASSACSDSIPVAASPYATRSDAIAASLLMGGTRTRKESGRGGVPLFDTTSKSRNIAAKASSPPPPRVSAHRRLLRLEQQVSNGEQRTVSPVVVKATESGNQLPRQKRLQSALGASQNRGGRASESTTRGKLTPVARTALRAPCPAHLKHEDRATAARTTGMNASAQRSLELFELRSRITMRALPRQRSLSPILQTETESAKTKSVTAEPASPELSAPAPQRRAILFSTQLPSRRRRQRRTVQAKKDPEAGNSARLRRDLSEKVPEGLHLRSPCEGAVNVSTTERQQLTTLVPPSIMSASIPSDKRNLLISGQRSGNTPQRSASKERGVSAVLKRPATAQR